MRVERKTSSAEGEVREADDVADSSQHLVILAGPGAGKTWLARRIACRAADRASGELQHGAQLDNVEIPLLLTCEQFRTAPGSARDAAVTPAIDSVSDLGSGVGQRLKSFLLERDDSVLLILDSLDEATTGRRDIDQVLIGSWRTALTSRPASWQQQWGRATKSGAEVVEATLIHHPGCPVKCDEPPCPS